MFLDQGSQGDGALELRIPSASAAELEHLMTISSVRYGEIYELAAGTELITYGVYGLGALGGFTGLAKVLFAFFHQHDGKKWLCKIDGKEVSAEGCSLEDAQHWIKAVLEQRAEPTDEPEG